MERKPKGIWAVPISARRQLVASVPIRHANLLTLCSWDMGEVGDLCGDYRCWCNWEDDHDDDHEPQFMCLSTRARAMCALGVERRFEEPCTCDACRFRGFGTVGDLMATRSAASPGARHGRRS